MEPLQRNVGKYSSYPIGLDSDSDADIDDCSTSSEDELDVLLNGSLMKRDRLRGRSLGQKSSSDDEFEKEMATELNERMAHIESCQSSHTSKMPVTHEICSVLSNQKPNKCDPSRYEDEFLDSIDKSDDEDTRANAAQAPLSNDDLLYDPKMDDEDQKWVDKQRIKCQPKSSKKTPSKSSDSTLSCPACMTFLCRDCQRHSVYKNQFRAMFVTNCTVDDTERLKYPTEGKKNKKNKNKRQKTELTETSSSSSSVDKCTVDTVDDDMYNPVKCSQCTTEVGVYDKDDVYHFFNVIESNG